ncbi:hypothetical protein H9Q10_11715 [Eikenella sp. S3360]|uniref:Uncharacterized protein n=1 Tax=Eikenella glucosivorans TaxID=2766967 RepID=A0ABS0NDE1_9NEIS|nr:DUF6636 domain-containing protein [Eikenella glucosivorans]MBH5330330.1 hypothetical protein [Eikenella glucosivorans]
MRTLSLAALLLAAGTAHAELSYFQNANGQITCEYGGAYPQITCEVSHLAKPIPVTPEPRDCDTPKEPGQWSGSISLFRTGPTRLNCNRYNLTRHGIGSVVLTEEKSYTFFNQPNWQCTSQSGSMTCTNPEGHGFEISPNSLRRF